MVCLIVIKSDRNIRLYCIDLVVFDHIFSNDSLLACSIVHVLTIGCIKKRKKKENVKPQSHLHAFIHPVIRLKNGFGCKQCNRNTCPCKRNGHSF